MEHSVLFLLSFQERKTRKEKGVVLFLTAVLLLSVIFIFLHYALAARTVDGAIGVTVFQEPQICILESEQNPVLCSITVDDHKVSGST